MRPSTIFSIDTLGAPHAPYEIDADAEVWRTSETGPIKVRPTYNQQFHARIFITPIEKDKLVPPTDELTVRAVMCEWETEDFMVSDLLEAASKELFRHDSASSARVAIEMWDLRVDHQFSHEDLPWLAPDEYLLTTSQELLGIIARYQDKTSAVITNPNGLAIWKAA